jgi:signal transduction histidine kinase/CheY-like chemotaxis protein
LDTGRRPWRVPLPDAEVRVRRRALALVCALAAVTLLLLSGAPATVALPWSVVTALVVALHWRRLDRKAAVSRLCDAVRDAELVLEVGVGGHAMPGAGAVRTLDDQVARVRRLTQRALARHGARTAELSALERRYEETLATVRGRSDFMANLCHEIRTPLNGLLGFLTMLSETNLDDQQREWVGIARSSGESLLALLNDVLDLAKIEAGKLTLERIEFDRDELFENVTGLFAPSAQTRGVELLLDLDRSVPARLLGDPVRLRQVVANLVGNAVKFTPSGHVEVSSRVLERSGPRLQLEIQVTDSGVGIAPDRLARLFAPFEQAEASTARCFGGTGLGLAIVKRIVEQMAGEISVDSEVGRGTRFIVRVPLGVASNAPAPAPRARLVLVIDGHARRREVLARTLRTLAAEVVAVADPTAALAAVRAFAAREEPLVVFADDAQPVAGELLAAVRARVGSRLVVLRPPTAAYDAVADGVDSVLVRPLRRAVLDATILGEARPGTVPGSMQPTWPGRRVLLVEDNAVNQRLMCTLLARLGVEVLLAGDGRQAVEAFGRYTCDMVLMDVQMPVMDGIEATRAIRAMPGSGESVPIVALTANAGSGDREACLAAGMSDYLTKPVRAAALRETMARFMPADEAVLAQ